ncbi:hypothetical protein ACFL1K_01425 [Candidatus Omnitrophota bacterium]
MVNPADHKKGATLIELIIMILVLAIIGATISGTVLYFAQLFMYGPRKLDTQKIAQELANIIIEGDENVRGARYSRQVLDADATQYSYTYGYPAVANQLSVRFRWDATDKHIYRSTSTDGGSSWSSGSVVPYYMPSSITIDGKDAASVIFTYKRADDSDWTPGVDPLTAIRRLILGISFTSGTGSFSNFEGFTDITSSVEIKGF